MYYGHCDCSQGRLCKSPAKHPMTATGFKEATTDEAQIRAWWKRWPTANIAIATGDSSGGLVVIDCDIKHGGPLAWEDLVEEHGGIPDTATATTGSGGKHIFFHCNKPLPSGQSVIAPGIDHKAAGGYVVTAPSLHACGERYKWDTPGMPIAELPDWVYALTAPKPLPMPVERKAAGNPNAPPPCIASCMNACAWLRHCRDDAVTLHEDEWYLFLGVIGRCVNGEKAAHDFSRPYPGYTVEETARKLLQALAKAAPVTCATIQRHFSRYCKGCRARAVSPISPGYRTEEPPPIWEVTP
jgi:hypothetical protein